MNVTRSDLAFTVTLSAAEAELLSLALKRATFEDTDPLRQRDILGFALQLLRALEEPR